MAKKKKRGLGGIPGAAGARCPYCGSPVVLRSAEGIYINNADNTRLYVCTRYPICDAYVKVQDGTAIPAGSLANGVLRALRIEAHRCFDRIHKAGILSRKEAYAWLASVVAAPMAHAHIGQLGEYGCKLVIEESKKFMENRKRINGSSGSSGSSGSNGYGAHYLKTSGGERYATEYRTAASGGG